MKIRKISVLSIAVSLAFASCSQEDIESFNPSYEALNIGFGHVSNLDQEMTYNYSESLGERGVTFYARVAGIPVDYDRMFTLEVKEGDVEKAQGSYRVETYVIPAGEVSGEYKIYFDPTKLSNPDVFSDEDGELVFKVAPNDNFAPGAKGSDELRITLKNGLTMPDTWNNPMYGTANPGLYLIFGDYSIEKYQLMLENGCPVNFKIKTSQIDQIVTENGETTVSKLYAYYLRQVFQKALEEYNNSHDNPLCDSFGNPITFPTDQKIR